MKILKRIGQAILVIAILLAIAYTFRRDPIGPLAGKALTGERMTQTPDDWGFSDEHMQFAVEVRPEDPHSVTTIGFVHDGALHIPAMNGSEKVWPGIAVADPRVQVKIGERVYPGLATRVTEEKQFEAVLASAAQKYPQFDEPGDRPPDLWVFRIEPIP
jgi:hypothetical protein